MIRRSVNADINRVSNIWLDTNIKAHNFICEQYWRDNFEPVKEMLSQSEIYVYEDKKQIQGFIGLSGNHIEGIFICEEMQSQGIGKQLLNFVKAIKEQLSLDVYQKNSRAVKFYLREDFKIQSEGVDENTGENDYFMIWEI